MLPENLITWINLDFQIQFTEQPQSAGILEKQRTEKNKLVEQETRFSLIMKVGLNQTTF